MNGPFRLNREQVVRLWEKFVLILEKGDKRSEFLTRVEDIKRDSYVLEMPIRQSGELHLTKGDVVQVTFSRADAVYSFKASILDLFEGDSTTLKIAPRSEIERIQRRRYVRLDISGQMAFRVLSKSNDKEAPLSPEISGRLLNISAGGVLFESPIKLKKDELITISFSLKGHHSLRNVLAIPKRCEGSKTKGFLVGVEFITKRNKGQYDLERLSEFLPPGSGTFDENLQKLIVQFIYAQQVELRKKGLLAR
jgi:c-di-GMP-binding flagellar brake protein YcgR